MYHELVYHLDLCILIYHLYAQSLVWPLDPYFEMFPASGTSRRVNFMKAVHEDATNHSEWHGPGPCQGWPGNPKLDPILCRFDQFHPWLPGFTRASPDQIVFYETPRKLTGMIKDVYASTYKRNVDPNPHSDFRYCTELNHVSARPGPLGAGRNTLYVIEGGTGAIVWSKNLSWSPLGLMLVRETTGNNYDVHFAFRGSRSGSAARAFVGGAFSEGNPDWATDLGIKQESGYLESVHGSKFGAVAPFLIAVSSCIAPAINCMMDVQTKRGQPPDNIWVTGHSLGGALGGIFAGTLMLSEKWGPYGAGLPKPLDSWPWRDRLQVITYSAPVLGDERYRKAYNSRIYCRRIMLGKDPITQQQVGRHCGAQLFLEAPRTLNPLPFSHHEPAEVRKALIPQLINFGDDLRDVPGHTPSSMGWPWFYFKSPGEMVDSNKLDTDEVKILLRSYPGDFKEFLARLFYTIDDPAAYKTLSAVSKSKRNLRKAAVDTLRGKSGVTTGMSMVDATREIADVIVKVLTPAFQDDKLMLRHLGLSFALCELITHPYLTLKGLKSQVAIGKCFK